MTEHQIPEYKFQKFEDKVYKLNRKAVQLFGASNAPQIQLRRMGTEFVEVEITRTKKVQVKVVNVTIEVPEEFQNGLKMNGWEFIARIDHGQQGNIISRMKTVSEEIEIPKKYRTSKSNCNHCQHDRTRVKTYLLYNNQEFKQIGSTCLKDFTGHQNPEQIANWMEHFGELFAEEKFDNYDLGFGGGNSYIRVEDYLPWVFMTVEKNGWTSKSNSNEFHPPTATLAIIAMDKAGKENNPSPSDKNKQDAQDAIEWIKSIKDPKNDFLWNLQTLVFQECFDYRHMGFVAAIYIAYHKNMEWEFEQKKKNETASTSEYIGEIKVRMDFNNLELVSTLPIDSNYGVTILHKFLDENGNILVWFSSSKDLSSYQAIEEKRENGEIIDENNPPLWNGKATIKDHKEFKGQKQTIITRAKFK